MEIIGTIFLIILAICALAAAVYFAGPFIIVAAAYMAERLRITIEEKYEEWREIINVAKGEK